MAELNTGGGDGGGKKVRSKKQSTRVDLTAMVDLAFLLLSFFILTTTLAKPQAMDVAKPDKDDKNDQNRFELKASVTMTALLGKNDKIVWYMGDPKEAKPQIADFNTIRKVLIDENKKVVDKYGENNATMRFTVVVKPTDNATYKNFVDMMDELAVSGVKTAPAIDDDPAHLLEPEKQFMRQQGIL